MNYKKGKTKADIPAFCFHLFIIENNNKVYIIKNRDVLKSASLNNIVEFNLLY